MTGTSVVGRALAWLYTICGAISAFFLAAIAALTLAQIVARQLGTPFEGTELSGFCLAAATFFGLAYTFVRGELVRVTILDDLLSARARHIVELACCVLGTLVSGMLTAWVTSYARESYEYGDLSPGLMAVPMWIPQSSVALGLGVLTIAMAHQVVRLGMGRPALYEGYNTQVGE